MDITGTESYVAVPGLTLGGWFWSDSISTQYGLMSKYTNVAGNRSYWIQFLASQTNMAISTDGTANTSITLGTNLLSGAWYLCVGRFIHSTEVKVFTNELSATNVSAIKASIFSGNCAAAISDAQYSNLFQATRAAFGV